MLDEIRFDAIPFCLTVTLEFVDFRCDILAVVVVLDAGLTRLDDALVLFFIVAALDVE